MTPAERRSLINRVRMRLRRRPREVEYKHVAERGNFSLGWVRAFGRSQYENPDIELVLELDKVLAVFEGAHK